MSDHRGYKVGEHLIWNVALNHNCFPCGFYVKCIKCEKIMLNHDVLQTKCEKEENNERQILK